MLKYVSTRLQYPVVSCFRCWACVGRFAWSPIGLSTGTVIRIPQCSGHSRPAVTALMGLCRIIPTLRHLQLNDDVLCYNRLDGILIDLQVENYGSTIDLQTGSARLRRTWLGFRLEHHHHK